MIKITIRHENQGQNEFGYGVYVNAYVAWDDIPNDKPLLYASECVPHGQATPDRLKAAEKRVRENARYKAKKEWMA